MGRKDVTVVDVLRIAGILLLIAVASAVTLLMSDHRSQKPPSVSDAVRALPAPPAAREGTQRAGTQDALRTATEAIRDALPTAKEVPAPTLRELLQTRLAPAPFGATSKEDFDQAVHLILETGIAEARGTLQEGATQSSAEYWSRVAKYVRASAACRALDWATMFLGSLAGQGRVFNLRERPVPLDSASLVSESGPVPAHYRDSSAELWTLPAWTEIPDADVLERLRWTEPAIPGPPELPGLECSRQLGALLVARLDVELGEVAAGEVTLPIVSIPSSMISVVSGRRMSWPVELTLDDAVRSLKERGSGMTDPDQIVASAFIDLKTLTDFIRDTGGAEISNGMLLAYIVTAAASVSLPPDKVLLLTNAVIRLRAERGGAVQAVPIK